MIVEYKRTIASIQVVPRQQSRYSYNITKYRYILLYFDILTLFIE